MRRHSTATLMGLTKKELVEYVRIAEHNQEVAEEALNQQAENVKDWYPVVHGWWKDIWGGKYENKKFRCSVCNGKALYDTKKDELGTWVAFQQLTQFCPNCGAKMDGDGNA